jgi:peptidyl-prolyl cis-trans isomerase A (cyclophilin A)
MGAVKFRGLLTVGILLSLAGCASPDKKPEGEVAPPAKGPTPEKYRVKFDTSKGLFEVEIYRDWAPRGADRFYELVKDGYFDDGRFFRVLKHFVVQFGLNKDPKVSQLWSEMKILDDPAKERNIRGTLTFAMRGPNTRTTQVFINLGDNHNLDSSGFAPFGKVVGDGMETVEKIYSGYGEAISRGGNGPEPMNIMAMGNEYLIRNFPQLDYVKTAKVE